MPTRANRAPISDQFAMMYGTKSFGISEDARVMYFPTGEIVIDPWKHRILPTKRFKVKNEQTGEVGAYTLPELMIYTYMGRCKSVIRLKYEDEPPTIDNCFYGSGLQVDRCEPGKVMYIADDEYRICGFYKDDYFYVNRNGTVIAVAMLDNRRYRLEYDRWEYRYGYPFATFRGISTRAIHTLVWNAWSSDPFIAGHDIHHKDECKWNASIDNLVQLSKAEHSRVHQNLQTPRYRYTEDDARYVCEELEKHTPIQHIVEELARRNGGLYNSAGNFVSRVQRRMAFVDISDNYDIDCAKQLKHRGDYTEDQVVQVCELLVEGKASDLEISRRTGVAQHFIRKIRLGRYEEVKSNIVKRVARRYAGQITPEIRKTGQYVKVLDEDRIRKVIDLRQRSNWSNQEIGDEVGCCSEVVRYIANGIGSYSAYGPVECVFSESERRQRCRQMLVVPETDPRVIEIRKRAKWF